MTQQKTVPYFPYPRVFLSNEDELTRIFQDVGRRGAFILQKDLTEFENALAAFAGVRFAVGVANCTDGLTIALETAGVGPGDEVIFPSHTFVATAEAIHAVGAVPVPVECGRDHLMDVETVETAVTKKTKAIMPVHLNGRVCRMDRIGEIAKSRNLTIVEDAAQALGAKFKGKCAGSFGASAALSFYPAKSLGCLGDGGAVLTDDPKVREKLLLLRDHGRDHDGETALWARNSRLDNLQAAFLHYFLKKFPQNIERRRKIAALYQEGLGSIGELVLPPAPDSHPDHFDTYQNYEIEADRRNELQAFLKEHGIGTLVQWSGKAVHQFGALGFRQKLPRTEKIVPRLLCLPMNHFLADEDVACVCAAIRRFYGK